MSILDKFRLDGRVVIVTGASSGLGVAFAHGFAEAGADVVLGARARPPSSRAALTRDTATSLPLLVTSEALLTPHTRRMAVELLRHAKLTGALERTRRACARSPFPPTDAEWLPIAASSVALIDAEARGAPSPPLASRL